MSLGEKLRKQQYDAIWKEYCGFLDLTMQDYMKIQNRLMEEQIQLWSDCELGKSILKGRRPSGIDEFRRLVPLTTFPDSDQVIDLDEEQHRRRGRKRGRKK